MRSTEWQSLGQRLMSGARAQLVSNVALVVMQLGTVAVLLPTWGVRLYGEWLILTAVPTYLALSELGLFSAAGSDMTMAVARGELDTAGGVFWSISRAVGIIFGISLVLVTALAGIAPLRSWLNLGQVSESTAAAVVVMVAVRTLLISYAGLIYGVFASVGRYAEGVMWLTAITFSEFLALLGAAAAGHGPGVAAAAMLACRMVGDAAMYLAVRSRAPWIRGGVRARRPGVIKRLLGPGLASSAIGSGAAVNLQGMIILIGVVAGPASAAIFATIRAMTRMVFQLLLSISETVAPELAMAYAADDRALLRKLHRRASQTAVWTALPLIGGLGVFGGLILHVWTHGRIGTGGALLYLFLLAAGIDALWFTSGGILFWTNRHARVARIYMLASLGSLALAYLMLEAWGVNGAAAALIALELAMLVVVLRQSLPAAHDTLRGWLTAIVRPPRWALLALRAQFAGHRGS